MSLQLEVDLASGVPPYEQIRTQVVAHASGGRLRSGDRLPTIRALATDLGVAAGTVARAYRELEAAGVVTTRRRTGTVVAEGAPATGDALSVTAREFVATARGSGLSNEAVLDLVRGALLAPAADRPDPPDHLNSPDSPDSPQRQSVRARTNARTLRG